MNPPPVIPETVPYRPESEGHEGLARLEVGDLLARYVLLDEPEVGDPSRLRHFLALDLHADAPVDLVVASLPPYDQERFLAEAAVARQLDAPGLPRVLAAGVHDEMCWMASRSVTGVTLRQVLAAGPLDVPVGARVSAALVATLAALHGRGLVHGALTPRKTVFTERGVPHLAGYMPAAVLELYHGRAPRQSRRRPTAPEWEDAGLWLPTTDVFALGCLLFEAVTGVRLLPKATRDRHLENLADLDNRLAVGSGHRNLPPEPFRDLLARAVATDRNRRPTTATNLASRLDRSLAAIGAGGPVSPVIAPRLRYPARALRRSLMDAAERRLEEGRALAAATQLRQFAELAAESGLRERAEARRLLTRCLWALVPAPRSQVASAICHLVDQAASKIGSGSLSTLARLALRERGNPNAAGHDLAMTDRQRDALVSRTDALEAALRRAPDDPEVALSLALLDTALVAKASKVSIERCHAEVLLRRGLAAAAVARAATAPGVAAGDEVLLKDLAHLIKAARTAPAPAPVSAGPDAATTLEEVAASVAPSSRDDRLDDAIDRARGGLARGDFASARAALGTFEGTPDAALETRFAEIFALLREMLWVALRPAPPDEARTQALALCLAFARKHQAQGLVALSERVLVASLPSEDRAQRRQQLEHLLERFPDSIPVLQAACRLAAEQGENSTWIAHLDKAGETFLSIGEAALASRMYMAIRGIDPEARQAEQGMQQVFTLGERLGRASEQLNEALDAAGEDPGARLDAIQAVLSRHPWFQPALEALAALAAETGDHHRAAAVHLDLAKRALLREEGVDARRHLRAALENDPEGDEALMYLAIVDPPPYDAPTEIWRLKIALLEREELWDAATHRARALLTGRPSDFSVHAVLATLCRRAGRDPSGHLISQGHLALRDRDPPRARDCFLAALAEAPDPQAVAETLLRSPEVHEALTPSELLAHAR